jgi:hypothetical protein
VVWAETSAFSLAETRRLLAIGPVDADHLSIAGHLVERAAAVAVRADRTLVRTRAGQPFLCWVGRALIVDAGLAERTAIRALIETDTIVTNPRRIARSTRRAVQVRIGNAIPTEALLAFIAFVGAAEQLASAGHADAFDVADPAGLAFHGRIGGARSVEAFLADRAAAGALIDADAILANAGPIARSAWSAILVRIRNALTQETLLAFVALKGTRLAQPGHAESFDSTDGARKTVRVQIGQAGSVDALLTDRA